MTRSDEEVRLTRHTCSSTQFQYLEVEWLKLSRMSHFTIIFHNRTKKNPKIQP
jgi:hypothetical protein